MRADMLSTVGSFPRLFVTSEAMQPLEVLLDSQCQEISTEPYNLPGNTNRKYQGFVVYIA